MWLGSLITHLFCFYLLHTLDLCSFLFIDFRDKEKMREREAMVLGPPPLMFYKPAAHSSCACCPLYG